MDGNSLRNLQEAYMEVVENQQLDEAYKEPRLDRKAFVRHANRRSGFSIGTREDPHGWREPEMEKVAKEYAARTSSARRAKRTGKPDAYRASKEAQSKFKKEQVDIYDIILSHLLDEGYADTNKAAIAIMANMSEEWRESIIEGMDPSATDAAKKQATKTAVDFFTKPKKPLPPYEAKKPRFGALTTPDFDLGTKKSKAPAAPAPAKPKAKPTETEKPKAKPAATPAPAPAKPKATPAPAPTPVKKPPTPTASPKPTEPPKAETPKPSGGEVAGSKIGDKSDYSVAATAKMSDRTKTILGTKDSETGKTIRKAQFGSLSPRERQGLG